MAMATRFLRRLRPPAMVRRVVTRVGPRAAFAGAAAAALAGTVAVASCAEAGQGSVTAVPLAGAIERALPGTVRIELWVVVKDMFRGTSRWVKAGSGSGFVYDAENAVIMTNHHVLFPSSVPDEIRIKLVFPSGHVREGERIAGDAMSDIALLRVLPPRWRVASQEDRVELVELDRGSSATLRPTEKLAILGCPLGDDPAAMEAAMASRAFLPSHGNTAFLKLTAMTLVGNSGGPVVDASGRVVGVVAGVRTGSIGPGVMSPHAQTLAVSIEHANAVAKELLAEHIPVRKPFLGLSVEPIDAVDSVWRMDDEAVAARATTSGKEEDRVAAEGLLVRSTVPNGPAEACGLKPGDVIVGCNGQRVRASHDLMLAAGPVAATARRLQLRVHRWTDGDDPERLQLSLAPAAVGPPQ